MVMWLRSYRMRKNQVLQAMGGGVMMSTGHGWKYWHDPHDGRGRRSAKDCIKELSAFWVTPGSGIQQRRGKKVFGAPANAGR